MMIATTVLFKKACSFVYREYTMKIRQDFFDILYIQLLRLLEMSRFGEKRWFTHTNIQGRAGESCGAWISEKA